jgi:hypothetical protein
MPSDFTISPDADARGTVLSNVIIHCAGAAVRISPSAGLLEICLLCASAVPAPAVETARAVAMKRRKRIRCRVMVKEIYYKV